MRPTSRQLLQATVATMGAVATVAGARGVLQGAAEVPDPGTPTASVDSEYRFYAAWYHVTGLLLLRAARRPEDATTVVRAAGAALLLAASGRVMSIRRHGRPHRSQLALTAIEFALPPVLVPWQAHVARAAQPRSRR